jgi:ring-1,2-phenylacetyl-CoA epoxidase subunit PaaC
MAQAGIGADLEKIRPLCFNRIDEILNRATLKKPAENSWMQKGGRIGHHTEHLGYILAELQFLQRAYPGATW